MAGKIITGLAASFDLETFGLDPIYGRLLCGVVKPWGQEPKIFRIKRASSNDSKLIRELVDELDQYAILFAHNGLFYDRAMLNGRALHYGMPVLDPKAHRLYDPYLIAKRHLNCKRNSLDALATHFQLSEQKMHLSPEVWVKAALDHDEESMLTLVDRCVSDVVVLEELALRVMPLAGNITPNGSAF
jgi:uncharacterized protein YprB with RNaseH-like and TPR domain